VSFSAWSEISVSSVLRLFLTLMTVSGWSFILLESQFELISSVISQEM
jgi:hypothetical protein